MKFNNVYFFNGTAYAGKSTMVVDKEIVPYERDNIIEMAITKEELWGILQN